MAMDQISLAKAIWRTCRSLGPFLRTRPNTRCQHGTCWHRFNSSGLDQKVPITLRHARRDSPPVTHQPPLRFSFHRAPRAKDGRLMPAGLLACSSITPIRLPDCAQHGRSVAYWWRLTAYSCGGSHGFGPTAVPCSLFIPLFSERGNRQGP